MSTTYTIPQIPATKVLPRSDDYLESGGVTDGSAKILIGNFSQSVTTLAALKALSITNAIDGQCVLSKVGGIFYYDSTSSATPDNVTIVQPNTGSGRWLAAPGAFTALSASGVFSLTNATRNYIISNDGSSYRALELRGSTIEFNPSNSGIVGTFSTTGLAVTGQISVTAGNTGNAWLRLGDSLATWSGIDISDSSNTSAAAFVAFRNAGGTQIGGISRVTTTNAVAFNTTSDGRLKENVLDFTSSGPLIDALRPRLFDWVGGDDASKGVLGFVAQEVNAIDPIFARIGAVQVGDDGPEVVKQWAMDHSKLIPILTAEIKSLRARVAALEAA